MANPWAIRWNTAAVQPKAPSDSIISPRWETVEYARIRFRSVDTNAIVAAPKAVTNPMIATIIIASGDAAKMG